MKRFLQKLDYVKWRDVLHVLFFLIAYPIACLIKIILKKYNKEIWLICEEKDEARDNGYALFKYIRTTYPNKDVYYAINKKSYDYPKVKEFGNIISFGSLLHWIFYLIAQKNISSQKGGKPNAAVCYFLEVYGLLKNKRVFLQHGVILSNCEWLYYHNTKMRLFVCGAYPEYMYVKKQFGYPENYVQYLGLCRFDDLHNIHINRKQILFMPSWRNWIALKTKNSMKYDDVSSFEKTDYYKYIQELLFSKKIENFLVENDLELCFYPHRNMQKFIQFFHAKSDRIKIVTAKDVEISKILKESALMITDYSSVSVDFAYMRKPIVYFQFDLNKYRTGQYGEGYFNYQRDGFGPVCTQLTQVEQELRRYYERQFTMEDQYLNRCKEFFELYDTNNCKRNYEAIEAI